MIMSGDETFGIRSKIVDRLPNVPTVAQTAPMAQFLDELLRCSIKSKLCCPPRPHTMWGEPPWVNAQILKQTMQSRHKVSFMHGLVARQLKQKQVHTCSIANPSVSEIQQHGAQWAYHMPRTTQNYIHTLGLCFCARNGKYHCWCRSMDKVQI